MAQDDRGTPAGSPEPDPTAPSSLSDDGPLTPGTTPPGAAQISGAVGDPRSKTPNQGPVSGNRTPMIIALVAIGIIVVMVAVLVGASLFPSD